MLGEVFTYSFRKRLKRLVRVSNGQEAKALAVKISPIFSLTLGSCVLLYIEKYSYLTLVVVFCSALALGVLVSYRYSRFVLLVIRVFTAEPKDFLSQDNDKKP